jgi:RHS repeat-associated protein
MRVPFDEPWYEYQDLGDGWSQNYNMGVQDPTNGGSGAADVKYIFEPNGAEIAFTAPSVPTAADPSVQCQVQAGYAYLVSWKYNSSNGTTYYDFTDAMRNQYVTSPINSATLCSVLTEIIDRNGNAIHFNYNAPLTPASWPLLSSITDSANSPLLVINRGANSSPAITSVDDRYGRTVYYHVGYYASNTITYSPNIYACDHVSQIEPTDTPNPPDRYYYQYVRTANDGNWLPKLSSISVPNPTGSSIPATSTIAYDPTYATVSSVTDANGNESSFQSVNSSGSAAWSTNYEEVSISGGSTPTYNYMVSFDGNMSPLTKTDGVGNLIDTKVYGDANNPFLPTTNTDGNGHTWTYAYTPNGYGNLASFLTPRGVTTAYAWNFSNFGLGECIQSQDSSTSGSSIEYKSPTTVSYFEPSGQAETVTTPTPGTADSSTEVVTSYSYNIYGNVTKIVTPGNSSNSEITTIFGFGSTPQKNQVLSVTDNLGHSTDFTYDDQGNVTSETDAVGNTTYWGTTAGIDGYNIANQDVLLTYPATGETGSGNSHDTFTFAYPGGPETSTQTYDEGNHSGYVEQTLNEYGPEGELLDVSGSTEPAIYSYDALYRLSSLEDGDSHTTNYYYNQQGYLDSVTYPGYSGATPTYSGGTWSNVSGSDSIRNSSYDADGNTLTRVDGRGVTTTYSYSDPESQLTGISYSTTGTAVATQPSVSLSYDGFGRLASVDNGVTKDQYGFTVGSTAYSGYDDDDNLLNAQTGFYESGSIAFSKDVSYTYYPNGSKASTTVPSGAFSYSYDAAERPTSETNPFSETTSWSYQNNNALSGQTLSDWATTSYTRNAMYFLTAISNKDGSGNTLSSFSGMTYNATGDRTALTAAMTSDTAYSCSKSYGYNGSSELTSETSTGNNTYTNTFAYDAAENPTTFRTSSGKYYSADNQLSATGFAYDGDGNPTTYSSTALAFDVKDRLTSVGTTMSAGYNAFDMRAWKTNSSGTTYYLYDSDSTSPVCEFSSSGTVLATNTYSVHGLVSRNTSSGSTFYEFDPQGAVSGRLNTSGSCTSTSTADAFGIVTNSSTVSDPFGYFAQAGYYTDQETGLILTTFRYYDPGLGRFLNRDPSGYSGGINLYGYTYNRPVSFSDPSGLVPRLSPIGGPQSFEECVMLAESAYQRSFNSCNRYTNFIMKIKCQAQAGKELAAAIAECIAQQAYEDGKTGVRGVQNIGNGINDICHNQVPGSGGQPIFGPIEAPPWGAPPGSPINWPVWDF